jgi:hypothetical protein
LKAITNGQGFVTVTYALCTPESQAEDLAATVVPKAAAVLQDASAAFKEAEKEAPDAAARASDTLTGIQKDALRSVGISVQRYWANAVCC